MKVKKWMRLVLVGSLSLGLYRVWCFTEHNEKTATSN